MLTSSDRWHDAWENGFPAKRFKNEETVFEEGPCRVARVTYRSAPAQRNYVQKATRIAKCDLEQCSVPGVIPDVPHSADIHAFLHCNGERVVGMILMQKIWRADKATWNERCIEEVDGERWLVDFVWVHKDYRLEGAAKKLLRIALSDVGTSVEEVAWNPPFSESGKAFIRSVAPAEFYVAA